MNPDVDWVRFMVLMEGQCEPGMSEYEVTEGYVRLASIDPELWLETADERDTSAAIARSMSQWRETQRESELRFPCYPSDVKRWAESQLLEVEQELDDACNDEDLARLADEGRFEATRTKQEGGPPTKGRPGRPAVYARFVPLVEEEQCQRRARGEKNIRSAAIRAVAEREIPMPDQGATAAERAVVKTKRDDLVRGIVDHINHSRSRSNKT